MKRPRPLLLAAVVLSLFVAACSQTSAPDTETGTNLAAQALPQGRAYGLAKHSTGVYAVGVIGISQYPEHEGTEAFVRKYDANGNRIWSKRFGTLPHLTGASAAASDALSNLYVAGYTDDVLPGAAGTGGTFLRKYTPSGVVAWTKQSNHSIGALAVSGNNLYAASRIAGVGGSDASLRKYDSNGKVVWTRQFGTSGHDYARDVVVSDTGFVYVVGYTAGALAGSQGSGAMSIRKYTATGSVSWTRQFEVLNRENTAVSISGGNVYLMGSGFTGSTVFEQEATVLKLNTSGAVLWSRKYTSTQDPASTTGALRDVSADSSGVYLIGTAYVDKLEGCYGRRVYLSKLRSDGSAAWEKRIGIIGEWSSGFTVLARSLNEVYVGGWANAWACDDGSYGDWYVGRVNGTSGIPRWER